MRSARFLSAKLFEQIADPTSRYNSDYLAYRKGEIMRAELIARLPHVALLGDSACMGIYISSAWSTFWRAHTRRRRKWFLDAGSPRPRSPRRIRPAAEIRRVSKMLQEITTLVAC